MPESLDVLLDEAIECGLISDERKVDVIPEIVPMFAKVSEYFYDIVAADMERAATDEDPEAGLAVMQRSCMYLFAKGIEAVMLWGASPSGHIDMGFEPRNMASLELDSDLPPELHEIAAESMKYGLRLFGAHYEFMNRRMAAMDVPNEEFVRSEMAATLLWVPRIAISYGLKMKYHAMRGIGQPGQPSHATGTTGNREGGKVNSITAPIDSLSGPWRCHWQQGVHSGLESLTLEFCHGIVRGAGSDPEGDFDYSGEVSAAGDVRLTKIYTRALVRVPSSLTYVGTWDGRLIRGEWMSDDSPATSRGPFEMWPGTSSVVPDVM